MKCTKCGAEIKEGNLYCSKCGAEVQIVSAYNVLEDEFILDLQNREMSKNPKHGVADAGGTQQKKNLNISMLVSIVGFFLMLLAAFLVKLNTDCLKANQMQEPYTRLIRSLADADDASAQTYLEQSMTEKPEDLSVCFWMAWFYGKTGNSQRQIETLQKILSVDHENIYACRELIRVYVDGGDFEGLRNFYNECSGSRLTVLFKDYLVEPPVIEEVLQQKKEGDSLTITAEDGLNIYYTLDGTSPVSNGTLYCAPIRLKAGIYTLQAVACNESGCYSTIVSQELTVETSYQLGMPQVTPNSGEYLSPQKIYVNVPDGCTAYYTWNGNPTTSSRKYSGGISMPEGNNVLSVILVDAYGNVSSVQRVNYIYMPK